MNKLELLNLTWSGPAVIGAGPHAALADGQSRYAGEGIRGPTPLPGASLTDIGDEVTIPKLAGWAAYVPDLETGPGQLVAPTVVGGQKGLAWSTATDAERSGR